MSGRVCQWPGLRCSPNRTERTVTPMRVFRAPLFAALGVACVTNVARAAVPVDGGILVNEGASSQVSTLALEYVSDGGEV